VETPNALKFATFNRSSLGITMVKLPELNLEDEAEMRAFYASLGMSKGTTEAAIQAMRSRRVEQKEMLPRNAKSARPTRPVSGRKA
jgi:hypothetical protein